MTQDLENTSTQKAVTDAIDTVNALKLGFGELSGYNEHMRYRYTLTANDVLEIAKPPKRVLEIGAFTGVLSIALKSLGYDVLAHDIPFIINDPAIQSVMHEQEIKTVALDLADTNFSLESDQFDLIIFNEVIEHLNFNSIPLLREFTRMLRPGGIVYCATPNLASLKNRVYLARGKGFLNPIQDLIWQLEPNQAMSIGLHWREWTREELCQLFDTAGLGTIKHWYRAHEENKSGFLRRNLVKMLYRTRPALMPGQVGLFQKQ
ncbi:class I SAM-dependent methyltransferase [Rhodopirellula sallentina]|uniref:Methyltransferase type 11 n=1 Tax=Rhodopirellula sallentina SM41 TaxID=1263870 RepID=M5TT87_9BACT|nr:class I SAM-dependent methyltransferase [Rhodopirellula sallentina]EMI52259.1 methyltransferase type 11 [Rhodopirellula sallentina SM41]